jgi:hypothetical protein
MSNDTFTFLYLVAVYFTGVIVGLLLGWIIWGAK